MNMDPNFLDIPKDESIKSMLPALNDLMENDDGISGSETNSLDIPLQILGSKEELLQKLENTSNSVVLPNEKQEISFIKRKKRSLSITDEIELSEESTLKRTRSSPSNDIKQEISQNETEVDVHLDKAMETEESRNLPEKQKRSLKRKCSSKKENEETSNKKMKNSSVKEALKKFAYDEEQAVSNKKKKSSKKQKSKKSKRKDEKKVSSKKKSNASKSSTESNIILEPQPSTSKQTIFQNYTIKKVSFASDNEEKIESNNDEIMPGTSSQIKRKTSKDIKKKKKTSTTKKKSFNKRSIAVEDKFSEVKGDSQDKAGSSKKRQTSEIGTVDPLLYKPFEYGWRREVVYRASTSSKCNTQADVYYFAPDGRKFRSKTAINQYIANTDLTPENFTLFKGSIGINDPEKEIVRHSVRSDREKGQRSETTMAEIIRNSLLKTNDKKKVDSFHEDKILSPKNSNKVFNEPNVENTLNSSIVTSKDNVEVNVKDEENENIEPIPSTYKSIKNCKNEELEKVNFSKVPTEVARPNNECITNTFDGNHLYTVFTSSMIQNPLVDLLEENKIELITNLGLLPSTNKINTHDENNVNKIIFHGNDLITPKTESDTSQCSPISLPNIAEECTAKVEPGLSFIINKDSSLSCQNVLDITTETQKMYDLGSDSVEKHNLNQLNLQSSVNDNIDSLKDPFHKKEADTSDKSSKSQELIHSLPTKDENFVTHHTNKMILQKIVPSKLNESVLSQELNNQKNDSDKSESNKKLDANFLNSENTLPHSHISSTTMDAQEVTNLMEIKNEPIGPYITNNYVRDDTSAATQNHSENHTDNYADNISENFQLSLDSTENQDIASFNKTSSNAQNYQNITNWVKTEIEDGHVDFSNLNKDNEKQNDCRIGPLTTTSKNFSDCFRGFTRESIEESESLLKMMSDKLSVFQPNNSTTVSNDSTVIMETIDTNDTLNHSKNDTNQLRQDFESLFYQVSHENTLLDHVSKKTKIQENVYCMTTNESIYLNSKNESHNKDSCEITESNDMMNKPNVDLSDSNVQHEISSSCINIILSQESTVSKKTDKSELNSITENIPCSNFEDIKNISNEAIQEIVSFSGIILHAKPSFCSDSLPSSIGTQEDTAFSAEANRSSENNTLSQCAITNSSIDNITKLSDSDTHDSVKIEESTQLIHLAMPNFAQEPNVIQKDIDYSKTDASTSGNILQDDNLDKIIDSKDLQNNLDDINKSSNQTDESSDSVSHEITLSLQPSNSLDEMLQFKNNSNISNENNEISNKDENVSLDVEKISKLNSSQDNFNPTESVLNNVSNDSNICPSSSTEKIDTNVIEENSFEANSYEIQEKTIFIKEKNNLQNPSFFQPDISIETSQENLDMHTNEFTDDNDGSLDSSNTISNISLETVNIALDENSLESRFMDSKKELLQRSNAYTSSGLLCKENSSKLNQEDSELNLSTNEFEKSQNNIMVECSNSQENQTSENSFNNLAENIKLITYELSNDESYILSQPTLLIKSNDNIVHTCNKVTNANIIKIDSISENSEAECSFKCTSSEIEQVNKILETSDSSSQVVMEVCESIKLPDNNIPDKTQIATQIIFGDQEFGSFKYSDCAQSSTSKTSSINTNSSNAMCNIFNNSSSILTPIEPRLCKRFKSISALKTMHPHSMLSFCAGFSALKLIFEHLNLKDLLTARKVCKVWKTFVDQPYLWKKVQMKNSDMTRTVADILQEQGTEHLIVIEEIAEWEIFIDAISKIKNLRVLELSQCPAFVLENIVKNCPHLEVVNATKIKNDNINLGCLKNLKNLKKLNLRATCNMFLKDDLLSLQGLSKMSHLSLRSIKNLGKHNIQAIKNLQNLQTLELGECSEFLNTFGSTTLIELKNLERLRLEKVQGSCCNIDILTSASKLEKLTDLELINIDILKGFEECLPKCKNITKLLMVPTYECNFAVINHIILKSTSDLSNSLRYFVWGITEESLLLSKTYFEYLDDDLIPIWKSISQTNLSKEVNDTDLEKSLLNTSELNMIPLSSLEEIYSFVLPKTQVKIMKISNRDTLDFNLENKFQ